MNRKLMLFLALLQLEMFVIVEYCKHYPVFGFDPWTIRTPYKSGKWKLLCGGTRCEGFNLLPSLARVIATRNYSSSIHQSVPHTSQQVTTVWAKDEGCC